jgi:hypothetical protein
MLLLQVAQEKWALKAPPVLKAPEVSIFHITKIVIYMHIQTLLQRVYCLTLIYLNIIYIIHYIILYNN